MRTITEKITLMALTLIMACFLPGCEETTSVAIIDKVTSTTRPQVIGDEMFDARLGYGIGKSPYDAKDIVIIDYNGLTQTTAAEAIDDTFTPQAVFTLHNFFSTKDDPINNLTRMSFVSRNVFKRTDIEFRHRLPRAGEPILRDDGTMIAFGTTGETGGGRCHLALLELRIEKSAHAYPEGYSDEELENGTIVPLAWEGKLVHALLILDDGRGVYFVSKENGTFIGSVELPGVGFQEDEQPRGWLDPTGESNYIIIAVEGGFFLNDTKAFEVGHHRLTPGAIVLGPTRDGDSLIWVSYDRLKKIAHVHRRNLSTSTDVESIPFGKGLGSISMKSVYYSYYANCIFFEAGNDIWRMDINTGVYGKFTDTPREHEILLWVM